MTNNKNKSAGDIDEKAEKTVFNQEDVKEVKKKSEEGKMVVDGELLKTILEQNNTLQKQVAQLLQKNGENNNANTIDLLSSRDRLNSGRLSFYSDNESGQEYLLVGFKKYKTPTGVEITCIEKPFKDDRGEYVRNANGDVLKTTYWTLELMNIETSEIKEVEEIRQTSATKLYSQMYDFKKRRGVPRDDTPVSQKGQKVEQGEHIEKDGGYVGKVGTGVYILVNVKGADEFITVDINGKEVELPNTVFNVIV